MPGSLPRAWLERGADLVQTAAMSGSPAEMEVLAAQDAWKEAMITKDTGLFEKVLHADLVATWERESGTSELRRAG